MTIEILPYHEYEIRVTKQSEIDTDRTIAVSIGFRCPRCKRENRPALTHGEVRSCSKCNLSMQLYGNGLHCSTSPLGYERNAIS